jgi:type III pantothenate kinase
VTLLLDVGNTRVKAAVLEDGALRHLGSAPYRARGVADAVDGLAPQELDRAVVVVVAGPGVFSDLLAWAEGRGIRTERVSASREAAGVRCAYPQPERLGADRWAALVGARARTGEACLVVDAGSAITVDALAADGRHLGGFIIPGLALMAASLHQGTGDLAAFSAASAPESGSGFPTDTRPAIEQGALLAAAGLVRQAAERMPSPPEILLTGGDAEALAGLIGGASVVPALVLEGLARLAGS